MTIQVSATQGALQDIGAKAAAYQHPVFQVWAPIWRKLAHVREGAGGFLDGTYLVAHPREWQDHDVPNPRKPSKKLKARRELASYENIAASIIEAKKSALFHDKVRRRVGPADKSDLSDLEQWWEDVDGAGTHIDDFMSDAWDAAGTFGHSIVYMDKPATTGPDEPGITAADATRPYLRVYTPLDVYDWLKDDRGKMVAVKLVEAIQRTDFSQFPNSTQFQVRMVSDTNWTLYNQGGQFLQQGDHALGTLPIVILYSQRRTMLPDIGHSVLDDPQLYIDLYNLTSEVRELLRNQTFSQLSVVLDKDESVIDAQKNLATVTGTESALFSHGGIEYISPSADNINAYHAEIERRLRTIYRVAALQWEADTKDAEAKGSLQLKRADMNQRLSYYADELQRAEYSIAKLWYRAQYGEDTGVQRFKNDGVVIQYPESFDLTPFMVLIEQAQAAISLGMPPEVLKELRKSLIPKLLPEIDEKTSAALAKAVENAPADVTPADMASAKLNAQLKGLDGTPAPNSRQEQTQANFN